MSLLVSVIIPNYNCAPYLRQAVESALAQSYQPLDVVVVDDGSTDGSVTTIADLVQAGRVRLISQANAGVAAARNAGIAASTGAYLVFLDCDDFLAPTMVERLMALVSTDDHRVFAYADYVHVDLAGNALPESRPLTAFRANLEGNLLAALLVGPHLLPLSVIISRQLVEDAGGFDPRYTAVDDYDLWLRVSCAGAVARYLCEPLAYYRHRPDSQSTDTQRMLELEHRLLREFAARYADQVAAVMPDVLREFRTSAALVWRAGVERLEDAERYAQSLLLAQAHAQGYAQALHEELVGRDAALADAQAYAQVLVGQLAAHAQLLEDAERSSTGMRGTLEAALAEREAAFQEAETYARSLEAALAEREAAFQEAETYARSLEAALAEADRPASASRNSI